MPVQPDPAAKPVPGAKDTPGTADAKSPETPLEDRHKTPGDGTLQDANPVGLTSEELKERAKNSGGTVQPGSG